MVNIQVGRSNYDRRVAKEAQIALLNRFFEQNPVLNATEDFPAVIARAGMKKIAEVGTGHIRFVFSEPGTFNDDAFIVSGLDLYRMDRYGAATSIGTISNDVLGGVSMAATGAIGTTPSYLFIADGGVLWVYTENDSFFGPRLATALHDAFTRAGGKAEMVRLPAFTEDGHTLFFGRGGSSIWGPLVERYLAGRR